MFDKIQALTDGFEESHISPSRKEALERFSEYLVESLQSKTVVPLIFICTHNSRRSHLAQIWAQTMAWHFGLYNIQCYSGGTEVTAVYPSIIKALGTQGFQTVALSQGNNPVYAVKYYENVSPLVCFSKKYHDVFNPKSGFGAIMTCSSADIGCPFVPGAEARFSIPYEDPKKYDHSPEENEKYIDKSVEIGREMWWVFLQASHRGK